MSMLAISHHALLSDRHSAAIVTSDGCVSWLCFPRFDSESVFASLLDDAGGHWWIRPEGPALLAEAREYLDATMVLQSTYRTESGIFEITEAMEVTAEADPHMLGAHAPHTLLRTVRCTRGEVALVMEFRPRPEYGLVSSAFRTVPGGLVAQGGPVVLTLSTRLPLTVIRDSVSSRFTLREGESVAFALQFAPLGTEVPAPYEESAVETKLAGTVAAWRAWSAIHQTYQGPWRDLVQHSGRVLQALSYQPSGAIIAAATTSLPEVAGGERNWDYRFSWVRDASFTMQALWVAACPDEAHEFFDFMTRAGATSLPDRHLQIMFGVGGEQDLAERTLPHLTGWRGSTPVRVGNGAWNQPQLDVYGELLDAAFLLRHQLGEPDPPTRDFLIALADAAADQWRRSDNGIWEIRGAPRDYLFSKLMCWVALDRAVGLAALLEAQDRVEEWRRVAEEIRDAILERGWNSELAAFTQSFGSSELDASALMLPIVGFLSAEDPRIQSTVDAIIRELTDERGLVSRYRAGPDIDGLEGREGSFLLCTFWLAQVLAQSDRVEEAREYVERAIQYVNDVGLLAEEVDANTGELLGNFPQAFSHVGLVNAAWAVRAAEQRGQ